MPSWKEFLGNHHPFYWTSLELYRTLRRHAFRHMFPNRSPPHHSIPQSAPLGEQVRIERNYSSATPMAYRLSSQSFGSETLQHMIVHRINSQLAWQRDSTYSTHFFKHIAPNIHESSLAYLCAQINRSHEAYRPGIRSPHQMVSQIEIYAHLFQNVDKGSFMPV